VSSVVRPLAADSPARRPARGIPSTAAAAGDSLAGRPARGLLSTAAAAGDSLAGRPARGLLSSAAAAVESFFLEPVVPPPASSAAEPLEPRPVIAVFGLARGCGATVVARALAAELATRDPSGAAAVACDSRPAAIPLATHAAAHLARLIEDVPGATPRAVGRICLVSGTDPPRLADTARHHAPVVIDAGSDAIGGASASIADRVLLVTTSRVEPALARVGRECIARVGPTPIVVLNRSSHDQPGAFALPNSAMGARLALGGREPRGELGRAIAELVDLLDEMD
jgi:hypothetical protein